MQDSNLLGTGTFARLAGLGFSKCEPPPAWWTPQLARYCARSVTCHQEDPNLLGTGTFARLGAAETRPGWWRRSRAGRLDLVCVVLRESVPQTLAHQRTSFVRTRHNIGCGGGCEEFPLLAERGRDLPVAEKNVPYWGLDGHGAKSQTGHHRKSVHTPHRAWAAQPWLLRSV